jgi:hypothetical protein
MSTATSPGAGGAPVKRVNAASPLAPALWQRDETASQCTACSTAFSISRR